MHAPVRRPLVGMAVFFVAGILLGEYCPVPSNWLWGAAAGFGLCAVLSLLLPHSPWPANVSLFALVVAGGALYQTSTTRTPAANDVRHVAGTRPAFAKVKGVILTPVETEQLDPVLPSPDGTFEPATRTTFDLAATAIYLGAQWQGATGRIRVHIYQDAPDLRYGDAVEFSASLKTPPRPTNPGQFDYARFLARQGIFVLANVNSRENVRVVGRGRGRRIKATLFAFRRAADAALAQYTSPQTRRLLACMLLGRRRSVQGRLAEAFVRSGTAHVLAISGLHLMILAGTLWWLLCLTPLNRRLNAMLVLVFVGLFVVVTGMRASVQRAGIITGMMCLGEILRKRSDTLNSLAGAAVLILLGNPNEAFSAGFQLTFGAVLGIVCFTQPIDTFLFGEPSVIDRLAVAEEPSPMRQWLGRYGRANIAVSCAVMLATGPLVAWYFHIFTPVAILLNLLVFPFLWVMVSVGTVAVSLAVACGPLAWPLMQVADGVTNLFARVVLFVEGFRFAYLYLPGPSGVWLLGYYGVLLIAACRSLLPVKRTYIWTMVAALFILPAASRALSGPPRRMQVTCLDVGHGAAFLVEFPNGRNLLYDAGTSWKYDVGKSVIAPFLWERGIRRLDALVISHAHVDHYSGIPSLCERFRIGTVLIHRRFREKPIPDWVVGCVVSRGAEVQVVAAGDRVEGYGKCAVEVLHPPDSPVLDTLSPNDGSCLLRICWRDFRLLLTGDLEDQGARMVRRTFPGLRADAIQLPHHGALSSAMGDFVLGCSPKVGLVNAEEKDLSTVVQELARQGVKVYATPVTGAIMLRVDDHANIRVETFCACKPCRGREQTGKGP